MTKRHHDAAIDKWFKRIQVCIRAKGQHIKHFVRIFTFLRKMISAKTLV